MTQSHTRTPATTDDEMASFADMIREMMRRAPGQSGIDFATFSGDPKDVTLKNNCCYMRLSSIFNRDADGAPYDVTARLVGMNGRWAPPPLGVETEMMVFTAKEADAFGASWCIWGAQTPPGKLELGTAYTFVDDQTTELHRALAHVFKTATGTTFGTTKGNPDDANDKTRGNFQVTLKGGTRFTVGCDAAGDAFIELAVTDSDPVAPKIRTLMRLDTKSFSISTQGADPTKCVTAKWDGETGRFVSAGVGGFCAAHPSGILGVAGVLPLALGGGSASIPSQGWKAAT